MGFFWAWDRWVRPRLRRLSWPTDRRMQALLVVGAVLFAIALISRWTGVGPIGSDNDEYREVGRALLAFDGPVTGGGVEATKYPLGYPLLLAFLELFRWPITGTAIVINIMAVAVFVRLLVGLTLSPDVHGPRATATQMWLPATAVLVFAMTNPTLWDAVGVTMPDAMTLAIIAGTFVVTARSPSRRRVVQLTLLVSVGVLFKSLAVVLVPSVFVAIWFDRRQGAQRWRQWAFGPVVVPAAVLAFGAWAVAGRPEHTTGYAQTFWLVNPFDASLGEAATGDVLARLWTRMDTVLEIGAKAVVGPQFDSSWAVPVTVGLVLAGILGIRRLRSMLATYTLAYGVVLALWPFQSARLSSPILPVAVLGVGVLVRELGRVRRPWLHPAAARAAAVAAMVLVGLLAIDNLDQIRIASNREQATVAPILRDIDEVVAFLEQQMHPDDRVVSFDYRELSYRLERPVLPLGYTTDVEALFEASVGEGADWFVLATTLVWRREGLARQLIAAHPDRFVVALETDTVTVWRIVG